MITESYTTNGYWKFPFVDYTLNKFQGLEWYILRHHVSQTFEEEGNIGGLLSEQDVPWDKFATHADKPTLRWLHEDQIVDFYTYDLEGQVVSTEQFLKYAGLELSFAKGGFVLSKRISRIMRRYLVSGFFNRVNVKYLQQTAPEAKIWDGAGVVSRKFLSKFIAQLPTLTKQQRKRAIHMIKTANRVEYTIMSSNGQDKGHAIVSDTISEDFIIPTDTKSEIKFSGGYFVGFDFPHGKDGMMLDFQSMVNNSQFFHPQFLMNSLRQWSDNFMNKVEAGETTLFGQVKPKDLESGWFVPEFLARRGKVNQYPAVIKAAVGQHLNQLNHRQVHDFRLPINGGRYYVMTEAVGKAAGVDLNIPEGHCKIDPDYETLWVNDCDWNKFISSVAGGADHDDAFWVFPFEDQDKQRKILAWRSPNQMGEYILLKPTADSHEIVWEQFPNEPTSWPKMDSSSLPKRIDSQQLHYLYKIDDGISDATLAYSVENMDGYIERADANAGVLGAYCNILMACSVLYNSAPNQPPAPLEKVIDACVKTGGDLSQVSNWIRMAQKKIASHVEVPEAIERRLGKVDLTYATGHWIDQLKFDIKQHVTDVELRRDDIVSRASMPAKVISKGKAFENLGEEVFNAYTSAWENNQNDVFDIDKVLELAEQNVFSLVSDKDNVSEYILGAFYHGMTNYSQPKDTPLWFTSIAPFTFKALEEIGVLASIEIVDNKIVASEIEDTEPVKYAVITNAWFNLAQRMKLTQAALPSKIERSNKKPILDRTKAVLKDNVDNKVYINYEFQVQEHNGYQVLTLPDGTVFGYISKKTVVDGDAIVFKECKLVDGDLVFMY